MAIARGIPEQTAEPRKLFPGSPQFLRSCVPARLKCSPVQPAPARPATDLRETWHVLCQRGRLRA